MMPDVMLALIVVAGYGLMVYGWHRHMNHKKKPILLFVGIGILLVGFVVAFIVGSERKEERQQCMIAEVEAGRDVETAEFVCRQRLDI